MNNIRQNRLRQYTLQWKNHTLEMGKKTHIMGILNVTPDSFSDGGRYSSLEASLLQAEKMQAEGADIIDVGGESTRPGADYVAPEEELKRVLPVIKALKERVSLPLSIDSYKPWVTEKVLEAGGDIINDIWGFQKDPDMARVAAEFQVPAVLMHNQDHTEYEKDIMCSMGDFFRRSIEIALKAGVKQENIILDPGIGFGKTPKQNIEVMSRLGELNDLGCPLLLGASRKSMIGYILDLPAPERVEGTLATSVMGVIQGVDIIRVHDVKENYRTVKVADAVSRGIYG